MKKAVILCVLLMVLLVSCFQQNTADQRIIGTWLREDGQTWVFNKNGVVNESGRDSFYGISSAGRIMVKHTDYTDYFNGTLYFSPDGKRMIIDDYSFQKK